MEKKALANCRYVWVETATRAITTIVMNLSNASPPALESNAG